MTENGCVQTDQKAIEHFLVARLAEMLGMGSSEIDVDLAFADHGLSSRDAVSVVGDLERWLQRPVPVAALYSHPTISRLSQHLAARGSAAHANQEEKGDAATQRIAIIGIGCRLPGASGPKSFWELLCRGEDAITEAPHDRWDAPELSDPAAPGLRTRSGGFLENVSDFDAAFFGVSGQEAVRMDPQQRLLLEVAWEALEDAGLPREALAQTDAGVFVGISSNDYSQKQIRSGLQPDVYAATGNALSIAANRLSYFFDARGPSLAVDTACSSSLVAVHLACESLRKGDCSVAMVGGANLLLDPGLSIALSSAGLLARDGRCKTLDASADGYGRGEGVAVLLLKPLPRALEAGDRIYAVLEGSAINNDGRSNGLLAPNGEAQAQAIRTACRVANVAPADLAYVELHGTGTLLGDPVEAHALASAITDGRAPGDRCAVGSVKSNIGHLEAAAGIVGLIKVALALFHRKLPPSIHFAQPNPHIDFSQLPLKVQTELEDWSIDDTQAAGISSFGFGGTNAHAILKPPPRAELSPCDAPEHSAYLFPISARATAALTALAGELAEALTADSSPALAELSAALCVRRSHHELRAAMVASTRAELVEQLRAIARKQSPNAAVIGRRDTRTKLVFVYPPFEGQAPDLNNSLVRMDAFARPYQYAARAHRERTGRELPALVTASARVDSDAHAERQLSYAIYQACVTRALAALGLTPFASVCDPSSALAKACGDGTLSLRGLVRLAGPAVADDPADEDDLQAAAKARAGAAADKTSWQAEIDAWKAADDVRLVWLGSNDGGPHSLLLELARLHVAGRRLDFAPLFSAPVRPLPLPSYPWQRQRYWIDAAPSAAPVPFAGTPLDVASPNGARVWETCFDAQTYLADHRVGGAITMPAAGFMALVSGATRSLLGANARAISRVHYQRQLIVAENGTCQVQVALTPQEADRFAFHVFYRSEPSQVEAGSWIACVHGDLTVQQSVEA